MMANEGTVAVMLPRTVDVTRTVVFASSQLPGAGQGVGESALSASNALGDAVAGTFEDVGERLRMRLGSDR